jgi:signal transduction histidine kinase
MEDFLHVAERELQQGGVRLIRDGGFAGTVRLDQEALQRVFQNIVANARDAMPGGGTLRVAAAAERGRLRVEFADTGTGMPEEVRRRVGEPFFSHGKRHGTGLGMAIARRVVEEHGGTLEIDSAPGAGTTVRLLLPLAPRGR